MSGHEVSAHLCTGLTNRAGPFHIIHDNMVINFTRYKKSSHDTIAIVMLRVYIY